MKKNDELLWSYRCCRKKLIIMRNALLILLIGTFQVLATGSYSQTTQLNLEMKGATVKQVLSKIEDESEFYFLYNSELVDVEKRVDISIKNKKLGDVLTQLFDSNEVDFLFKDRHVVITPKDESVTQQTSISGTVSDEDGEPLPGVTVVVKGTTSGTITNIDGNYTIANVPEDATLQFSFVGMLTQEVVVGSQSTINVTMIPDAIGIEEVVAIGYGTVKKSDLTGTVSSVKSEDLLLSSVSSVDQAIQGRISGVQITQASSEPGGGVSIRIRGSSSVNAGNEPLYVIDGVPIDNNTISSLGGEKVANNRNTRNPMNSLNPSDIESIEVLKDASASAIYGSRGANGVILITTKSGSKGPLKINYNGEFGFQQVANQLDVLSTDEYIQTMNALRADLGEDPEFSPSDISAIGAGVHWQDEIFRTAPMQNHNLSFSGGSEKTTFFVSLNYYNQDGVVINSGIEKYIGRVNLQHNLNDRLKFGVNFTTSLINDDVVSHGISSNENAGAINAAINMDPTMPIYDEDGSYSTSPNIQIDNPLALANGIDGNIETNRTLGNFFLEYQLLPGLNARVNLGSDRATARRDVYNSTITIAGGGAGGIANVRSESRSNYLFESTLNYNKAIEKHLFNFLAGYTYQKYQYSHFEGNIRNFPSDVTQTHNLGLGDTEQDELGSNKRDNTLLSYLGRVNYSFNNKYLLTASIRADGSSRFGEDSKYGYFPSFAFAWKLSEESFINDLNIFNTAKLRLSWGETGNQEIGNYNSLTTLSGDGNAVINDVLVTAVAPARLANPDLRWETTAQTNVGLDLSFVKGRISTSFDYFKKNTKDMLLHLPIPSTTGYSSVLQNIGSIKNTGFEAMTETRNLIGQFKWNTIVNFTTIKNEVVDLGGIPEITTGSLPLSSPISIIKPGIPLNSYYGYEVEGIFQQGDDIAGSAQPNAQPGYLRFNDFNNDGVIDSDDRVVLGNPFPDFIIGLNNTFAYKGLSLDIFFEGVYGADILNNNLVESLYPINFRRNKLAEPYLNRWTPENPTNEWPSHVNPNSYGGGAVNSRTILDASFLRLKTVKLAYDIPLNNFGVNVIQNAQISVTGQNLLTLTDYNGFDPDVNSSGKSNLKTDYNAYPSAKIILFGINVGF